MVCHKCDRDAIKEVHFLGEWLAVCRYHAPAFYDLPQRRRPFPVKVEQRVYPRG
jgi:hypothetical protein